MMNDESLLERTRVLAACFRMRPSSFIAHPFKSCCGFSKPSRAFIPTTIWSATAQTMWDGVTQPHAFVKTCEKCAPAILAIIYHTGSTNARSVGACAQSRATLTSNPESDNEKHAVCDVSATKRLPRAVSLQRNQSAPATAVTLIWCDWRGFQSSPLNDAQWDILKQQLAEVKS